MGSTSCVQSGNSSGGTLGNRIAPTDNVSVHVSPSTTCGGHTKGANPSRSAVSVACKRVCPGWNSKSMLSERS